MDTAKPLHLKDKPFVHFDQALREAGVPRKAMDWAIATAEAAFHFDGIGIITFERSKDAQVCADKFGGLYVVPNDSHDLKALGESAAANKKSYRFENPDAEILETFKSPYSKSFPGMVTITVPEFTSLCPITGQPDFATIHIRYVPQEVCVESKSLKLYMGAYRNHGEFHEACVERMMRDLCEVLNPAWIEIHGEFAPRGGIPFEPTAVRGKLPENLEHLA